MKTLRAIDLTQVSKLVLERALGCRGTSCRATFDSRREKFSSIAITVMITCKRKLCHGLRVYHPHDKTEVKVLISDVMLFKSL